MLELAFVGGETHFMAALRLEVKDPERLFVGLFFVGSSGLSDVDID